MSRSGRLCAQARQAPGKRRGLEANIRDGNHLPECGLAHRTDREDTVLKRAPAGVDRRAIAVDVEAYAERIGAIITFSKELGDEGIGAAPCIAIHPST